MTFTITCVDSVTGEMGIATASRPPGVGRVVPLVVPGVGVVAMQGIPAPELREATIQPMRRGAMPVGALEAALTPDPWREGRQAIAMDARGRASVWTGSMCEGWAGSIHGDGWVAAGNMLAGEAVVQAMGAAFIAARGQSAEMRLLAAMQAGHAAGGDQRGIRSAALMVARPAVGASVKYEIEESADPLGDMARKMRGELVQAKPAPVADRPDRSDVELEPAEAEILATARVLVATTNKVALSYSGGAESGLLLYLLQPIRQTASTASEIIRAGRAGCNAHATLRAAVAASRRWDTARAAARRIASAA